MILGSMKELGRCGIVLGGTLFLIFFGQFLFIPEGTGWGMIDLVTGLG